MNPLTIIRDILALLPPRYRRAAYVAAMVVTLGLSAYQAADGDLVEALGLLLGSLVSGTAATHTPRGGQPSTRAHRHEIHVHVNHEGLSADEVGRQVRKSLEDREAWRRDGASSVKRMPSPYGRRDRKG